MDPKGHVLIKREFVATKIWPSPQASLTPPHWIDLEKEYKKALAGQVVTVMDICVMDTGYLVLGRSKEVGDFLWMIEKDDTVPGSFLPVIWKYGRLMPAGLTPIEEFAYLAKDIETQMTENDLYSKYNFKNKTNEKA